MAWKLRQFFEGDRIITVNDVVDSGACWVNGSGDYIPNTIAIKIDGVETLLSSAVVDLGFLTIQLPPTVYVSPTTTIQVYAVCEDLPASKTLTLTAKSVDFKVTNAPILACSNQVTLTSSFREYIRLFVGDTAGSFFNLKLGGTNMSLSDFSYQAGDSGNIAVTNGTFSRPATFGSTASLISNNSYLRDENPVIAIQATSMNYFTARLGYIELIFDNGNLKYNNYLNSSEFGVASGTYTTSDVFTIHAENVDYTVRKNGTVLFSKTKNISYTVSGGSVVPASSTVGTPVAWNLPTTVGTYDLIGTVGDSLKFKKSIQIHSCANAVDDAFTGVTNTNYSGDTGANDTKCTGENSYYELVTGSATGGTVVLNQNGTFVFTPTNNFNGVASFQYRLRCGANLGDSEAVDTATVNINYFNPCNGVAANWVANGQTRCTNCVEERQEIDTNAGCTNNQPRWVANPDGGACNRQPIKVATGATRCNNCVNEKEVQEINACHPDFQQKSWIANPTGTNCNVAPVFQDNGQFRCQDCVEQKQQIDITVCSPTYNQTRWVNNPGGTQCSNLPIWNDLAEYECINCAEFRKQVDNNPCSPTYQQKRSIANPNGSICSTVATWVDENQTRCTLGVHEKLQSNTNPCSPQQQRWVATGLPLCNCIAQVSIKAICKPDDFITNPIVGVEVYKRGVIEGNRLISFANNVVTFQADLEMNSYDIKLTRQNGMGILIKKNNYKCNL